MKSRSIRLAAAVMVAVNLGFMASAMAESQWVKDLNKAADDASESVKSTVHKAAQTLANATNSTMPPKADADMQKVLDAQTKLGAKPIETLTPAQARKQPTVADAVTAVLKQEGKSTAPEAGLVVKNITIPASGDSPSAIPARLYTPEGKGPFPVIVYYHGGGWVIANLDTYDASARALAKKTNAIVLSAHYRQAPEHPFPAAHQDAFTAYKYAVDHAASFNGDPTKIAVAGESAGANLAANVAIMARDANIQEPVHQVLIYPVASTDMNSPSYIQNANAKPLDKPAMQWFVSQSLKTPQDKQSTMINLVEADLNSLPPATIVTAQIDPLRSDGEELAAKLEKAGDQVQLRNYNGVTHEFFGAAAVVQEAKNAQDFVAKELQTAFTNAPTTQPEKKPVTPQMEIDQPE